MEVVNIILTSSIVLGLIAIIYTELKKTVNGKVDKSFCQAQHDGQNKLFDHIVRELADIKKLVFELYEERQERKR